MKKPGRVLITILIILVFIGAVLFGILEFYPQLHDRVQLSAIAGTADWMGQIDGDLRLSQISIPGAHDAAANDSQLRLLTKCQDQDIAALLRDGFRYLDIRLGIETVNGKKDLTFYHGFLHCLKGPAPWSGHLTFEDAASVCGAFLQAHPTETILFVVKQEHGSEPAAEFGSLLDELIEASSTKAQWLLTDEVPTLDEARGKIVLFRRYQDDAGLGEKAGIYLDWPSQGNAAKNENDPDVDRITYGDHTLFVQDRYKYDTEPKWQAFQAAVSKAVQEKAAGDIFINFLSSNGKQLYGHPYGLAKDLNVRFLNADYEVLPGWTIVDFGNASLAARIYRMNP